MTDREQFIQCCWYFVAGAIFGAIVLYGLVAAVRAERKR